MKIKNIKLNKNVTTFENDTNVELSIDKPNIIYGQNGSGKTTISRIFQYISKYVLDEDKVNTLENLKNADSEENLEIEILDYKEERININEPNSIKNNIVVFNQDYMKKKMQIEKFDTNKFKSSKITQETGEDLKNELKEIYLKLNGEYKKENEQIKQLKIKLKDETLKTIDEWKKKVDIRKNSNEIFKEIIENIEKLNSVQQIEAEDIIQKIIKYKNVDESSKIGNITLDLEKIKAIKENIHKCVIYNEDTTQLAYIKRLLGQISSDEKEWILLGTKYIKNNECPFCKSNIDNNDIVNGYKMYQNSKLGQLEQKLKFLLEQLNVIDTTTKQISIIKNKINNISTIIDNNEEISNKLNDLENQLIKFKEEQINIIQYKLDSDNLHRDCSSEEIYTSQNIKLEDIEKLLKEININFSQIDAKIETSSKQVGNLRNQYLNEFLQPYVAKSIYESYKKIKQDEEELVVKDAKVKEAKKNYEDDLVKKQLLIKDVNRLLDDLGIHKYKIDTNFHLMYKRKDVNDKFVNMLSEGERTSITFALFLAELKWLYEDIDIIVIDDPISSLDYMHIYNVMSKIKELFSMYSDKQIIILTHNNIFYNMFKYRNPYAYYKISNTEGKSNYKEDRRDKTLYMEKLKDIVYIADSTEDITEEQKKYIFNYCRYILETLGLFFFPNSNDALNSLQRMIEKIPEPDNISKTKLDKLFMVVNTGSHATDVEIIDLESEYTDTDYKDACKLTKRIVKYLCKEQLENME